MSIKRWNWQEMKRQSVSRFDADVVVYANGELLDLLKSMESELAEIFITSKAQVEESEKSTRCG